MHKSMPAIDKALFAGRQPKDGEKTAGGSPRQQADPLPISDAQETRGQVKDSKIQNVVSNNFFTAEPDK